MSIIEEITELENYFKTATIPEGPIQIKQGELSHDLRITIDTALTTLKIHPDNSSYSGYWERLERIKAICEGRIEY